MIRTGMRHDLKVLISYEIFIRSTDRKTALCPVPLCLGNDAKSCIHSLNVSLFCEGVSGKATKLSSPLKCLSDLC